MVYSGYVCFYGIHVRSREDLYDVIALLWGYRGADAVLLLAHQFQPSSIWTKVPKDIIKMILDFKRAQEKLDLKGAPDFNEMGDGPYELEEYVSPFLNEMRMELGYLRCCYFDGSFFVGVCLGGTDFVYRSQLRDYVTFEAYNEKVMEQLTNIEKTHAKREADIEKIKKRMNRHFRGSKFAELPMKVFTWANDCESCS
jgi:hypothetical protein